MAQSEGIKQIVNQVAIQAAMTVMMALREQRQDPNKPLQLVIEGHKDKGKEDQYLQNSIQLGHSGQICWIHEFEIGITNFVQIKANELTEEEKVPVIKKWLGQEGLQLIQTFSREEK